MVEVLRTAPGERYRGRPHEGRMVVSASTRGVRDH